MNPKMSCSVPYVTNEADASRTFPLDEPALLSHAALPNAHPRSTDYTDAP
jgi:hypothetical protein